jgi:hypothetical protein
MAARNLGISETTISRHLLKFQEQETPTDFEYTARNDVNKIFNAAREFELVEYFKQAAKLRYGLTKKEAVKLAFRYGKENVVVSSTELGKELMCWEHVAQETEETS